MNLTTTTTVIGYDYNEHLTFQISVDEDELLKVTITDNRTQAVMSAHMNADDLEALMQLVVRTRKVLFGKVAYGSQR